MVWHVYIQMKYQGKLIKKKFHKIKYRQLCKKNQYILAERNLTDSEAAASCPHRLWIGKEERVNRQEANPHGARSTDRELRERRKNK